MRPDVEGIEKVAKVTLANLNMRGKPTVMTSDMLALCAYIRELEALIGENLKQNAEIRKELESSDEV